MLTPTDQTDQAAIASSELRPEAEILMTCAQTRLSPAEADHLDKLLHQELDWECVLAEAWRHGLAPLLQWHVNAVCPEVLPKTIRKRLRSECDRSVASNLCLTAELLHILQLFESFGLRALCYKGPALAAFAYGNLLLRPFCDLDLLILCSELGAAEELLLANGYERKFHSNCETQEYAHKFVRKDDGIVLELHWNIVPQQEVLPLRFDQLWPRAVPLNLHGREVWMPAPEDLLLLLCWHGYKHCWTRLEWICCIRGFAASAKSFVSIWDGTGRRF